MPKANPMTTEQFLAMSPQERNELIADLCGYKQCLYDHGTKHPNCYAAPNGRHCELPDFQGSNGLAFEELWDEIRKVNPNLIIVDGACYTDRSCCIADTSDVGPDGVNIELFAEADTWAHAICIAYINVKGAAKC